MILEPRTPNRGPRATRAGTDNRRTADVPQPGAALPAAHEGGGDRAGEADRARRHGRQGPHDQLEPAAGRVDRAALPGPGPAALRSRPGGHARPDPGGGEVRLAQGLQASRPTRRCGSGRRYSAGWRTAARSSGCPCTSPSASAQVARIRASSPSSSAASRRDEEIAEAAELPLERGDRASASRRARVTSLDQPGRRGDGDRRSAT